jgi:hypothetical protein
MVMLSSGSSSSGSSSDEETGESAGQLKTSEENSEDELRRQNIANFRAQMRLKKQESDVKSGGFSSSRKTNRMSTRQSVCNPDSIPAGARGSVSRVLNRGTIVQNRATFSGFRPPDSGESSGDEEVNIKTKEEARKEIVNNDDDFWNATDTHHMLPVFAAARAYVPSTFESLLVQSFFGVLTPMMCEIFVCGQSGQSIMQIDVPEKLYGRTFLDMFRIFSYHQVNCCFNFSLVLSCLVLSCVLFCLVFCVLCSVVLYAHCSCRLYYSCPFC